VTLFYFKLIYMSTAHVYFICITMDEQKIYFNFFISLDVNQVYLTFPNVASKYLQYFMKSVVHPVNNMSMIYILCDQFLLDFYLRFLLSI
jgi:hypothetical protein